MKYRRWMQHGAMENDHMIRIINECDNCVYETKPCIYRPKYRKSIKKSREVLINEPENMVFDIGCSRFIQKGVD